MRRFPIFSSESTQGGTANGLLNCTDLGGNTLKRSEEQKLCYGSSDDLMSNYCRLQSKKNNEYEINSNHYFFLITIIIFMLRKHNPILMLSLLPHHLPLPTLLVTYTYMRHAPKPPPPPPPLFFFDKLNASSPIKTTQPPISSLLPHSLGHQYQ